MASPYDEGMWKKVKKVKDEIAYLEDLPWVEVILRKDAFLWLYDMAENWMNGE